MQASAAEEATDALGQGQTQPSLLSEADIYQVLAHTQCMACLCGSIV